MGAELIGPTTVGAGADEEILAMAAEGLVSTGLRDFCIGLSDAGLLCAMLDRAGAGEGKEELIRSALAGRDYVLYGELVSSLGSDAVRVVDLLKRLPDLHTGHEALNALRTAGMGDAAYSLIRTLDALAGRGLGHYFRVDLAIARELDYYTGIVFEGYAPGCGSAVIGGGRYDSLLAKFGNPSPAAGFAIDVDSVAQALGPLWAAEASGACETPCRTGCESDRGIEGGIGRWRRQAWSSAQAFEAVRSRH